MNKNIIIVGLLFLLIILVVIVVRLWFNKENNSKELELTYEINAGIPFKWIYEIEDKSVVEFVKKYVVRDDNKGAKVGASVYTNYVFKGLKEGKTSITFKMVNITGEHNDVKEEKNIVYVDKDLNIYSKR